MTIFSLLCGANSFEREFSQIRPMLYRTAYSWCHNTALAEDLVQEALAKGIKSLKQLHDPAQFNSWLFKIMTNCWRDYYRKHREMDDIEMMDESLYADSITPEDHHSQSQIVRRVRDAVTKLPMGQRQVVTLVDLAEFSYAEVGEILAIPIGTVMSRLCRARTSLQWLLKEDAPATPIKNTILKRIK
ncbi:MAG TPA: RNA polymerase sigma factor [Burkholderiales bacterium]|nr:RNA polymerase sigma factor [Burkholderiales bacterium]